MNKIKLSIVCLTYNHAKFIRRALDGFIMQQTNFPFEVLIHDDASNDGTQEIIREYEQKYPNIIKPIYQTENQWGKKHIWRDIVFPRVQGQYVALCEGDDYWIDGQKLQKQVDFLETHPNYSICFHPVKIKWEDNSQKEEISPTVNERFSKTTLDLEDLLHHNFIQANSVVYRWRFHKDSLSLLPDLIQPGDWFLHLLHAQIGKIGYLGDVMAVYCRHHGGIWYDVGSGDWLRNYGLIHVNFFKNVEKYFNVSKKEAIEDLIWRIFFAAVEAKDEKLQKDLLKEHKWLKYPYKSKCYNKILLQVLKWKKYFVSSDRASSLKAQRIALKDFIQRKW